MCQCFKNNKTQMLGFINHIFLSPELWSSAVDLHLQRLLQLKAKGLLLWFSSECWAGGGSSTTGLASRWPSLSFMPRRMRVLEWFSSFCQLELMTVDIDQSYYSITLCFWLITMSPWMWWYLFGQVSCSFHSRATWGDFFSCLFINLYNLQAIIIFSSFLTLFSQTICSIFYVNIAVIW